jgi:glycosyltransferase involved in cell wall biosynthesis
VVASAAGGLPELVEDGVTGLLCPAGDPHALAERLDRLMGDAALCASLGVAGRRRAADHFDVANMVARIEAVYARLLES